MKRKILLVSNDIIGRRMAGPAIRYMEMAKVLSMQHTVTVAAPAVDGAFELPFRLLESSNELLERIAFDSDLVIVQGDALARFPFLKRIEGVLIADLYCPIPLEYHQSSHDVEETLRMQMSIHVSSVFSEQLVYADHFLCASEKQRDFWLGALTVAGRVNALRWSDASRANIEELISLVPFGLPSVSPKKTGPGIRKKFNIPDDAFVVLWGGGIYQWFDPLTVIQAIDKLVKGGCPMHLVFLGVTHPNPGVQQHDMCRQAIQLSERLGLINRFVHFNFDWTDYEDRQNYFLDADVGVSAHLNNPETRFAFRTRMLDYLWCGLPIIATRGDVFGNAIECENLGVAVEYEDVDCWVRALSKVKNDVEFRRKCIINVNKYACGYRWEEIMREFVKNACVMLPSRDRKAIREAKRFISERDSRSTEVLIKIRQAYSSGGVKFVSRLILRRIVRNILNKI